MQICEIDESSVYALDNVTVIHSVVCSVKNTAEAGNRGKKILNLVGHLTIMLSGKTAIFSSARMLAF